uniref:Uncharacterized protein n=1 Tax=Oryza punctata TaxID=4537 RepID=A0A0E0LT15_ORYPU
MAWQSVGEELRCDTSYPSLLLLLPLLSLLAETTATTGEAASGCGGMWGGVGSGRRAIGGGSALPCRDPRTIIKINTDTLPIWRDTDLIRGSPKSHRNKTASLSPSTRAAPRSHNSRCPSLLPSPIPIVAPQPMRSLRRLATGSGRRHAAAYGRHRTPSSALSSTTTPPRGATLPPLISLPSILTSDDVENLSDHITSGYTQKSKAATKKGKSYNKDLIRKLLSMRKGIKHEKEIRKVQSYQKSDLANMVRRHY